MKTKAVFLKTDLPFTAIAVLSGDAATFGLETMETSLAVRRRVTWPARGARCCGSSPGHRVDS